MKKLFKIAALLLFTAFITDIPLQNYAFASKTVKTLKVIKIFNDRDTGTASLTGKGENFFTDLKVNICFENNNPYEIFLEDGYSPYIETFDFGAEDKLLFCSSQTGGSGGYGNYRVYRIQTDSYKLLYDDKLNSNNSEFTAVFKPNGFIEILNNFSQHTLEIYVGYMDAEFYNQIFAADGTVKGEPPFINDISFVSPALNSASGFYNLTAYRSVSAIAEVNRLGYIVQNLNFDGNSFYPAFTEFSIAF